MHSFVRRLTLAVVALPLLLGGCAEDEPDTSPPDPTTTPPSVSEPWEEQSDEGAIAFAEHWFGLFNDARLEFDTEPLAKASTPECASCSNFVQTINQWRSDGTTYESGPWQIRKAEVVEAGEVSTELALRLWRPAETISPKIGPEQHNKGSRGSHAATLRWTDGRWMMHELVISR